MIVKDHFLSQENFELIPTEIPGILKTSPIPSDIGKYYESDDYISHNQDASNKKSIKLRNLLI